MTNEVDLQQLNNDYWNDYSKVDEILKEYNILNYHELSKLIRQFPLKQKCERCDDFIYVKSRTERDFKLKHIQGVWKNRKSTKKSIYNIDQVILCKSCDEDDKKESLRRWHIERQQYKNRLNQLKSMPYYLYLKTEEWQEKRYEALRKAKHRCQVCDKTKNLNVHHRTYERRGNERGDDLIVLCRDCHSLFHDKMKSIHK